eukprot:m.37926 g.37926  ORF g.37926 m.37926 type:complete len:320 (+) comp9371_c0_seq2:258-1217(+)
MENESLNTMVMGLAISEGKGGANNFLPIEIWEYIWKDQFKLSIKDLVRFSETCKAFYKVAHALRLADRGFARILQAGCLSYLTYTLRIQSRDLPMCVTGGRVTDTLPISKGVLWQNIYYLVKLVCVGPQATSPWGEYLKNYKGENLGVFAYMEGVDDASHPSVIDIVSHKTVGLRLAKMNFIPLPVSCSVQALHLYKVTNIDLNLLSRITSLREVALESMEVDDISPLQNMKTVHLVNIFGLRDVSPLASVQNVILDSLLDLRNVHALESVIKLTINNCKRIMNFLPLASVKKLRITRCNIGDSERNGIKILNKDAKLD